MTRAPVALCVSVLCGLVVALPFSVYEGSAPIWFCLAPMFWLAARVQSRRQACLSAAVFAFVWTLVDFSFLWHLTVPGTVALSVYTSAFYVAALLGVRYLARRNPVSAVFGVAALWTLVELLRSVVPVLGFPWLLLGHTLLHDEHLRQGADVLGVYGLSFLIAAVNAALAFAVPAARSEIRNSKFEGKGQKEKEKTAPPPQVSFFFFRRFPFPSDFGFRVSSSLTVAVLLLGTYLYGMARIADIAPRLAAGPPIGVIQGNVATKLGRTGKQLDEQLAEHMAMHKQLAAGGDARATRSTGGDARGTADKPVLICWAETMVPGALNADYWGTDFADGVAACGVPTLAGSNYRVAADPGQPEDEARCYNAAYLFDGDGKEVCRYVKRRLVAFGEYIPGAQRFPVLTFLRSITRDQYLPGETPSRIIAIPLHAPPRSPPYQGGDTGGVAQWPYHVALTICVEDIHPDLARDAALAGADTLINLTNDGWFYGTFGPRAHLQAAAWRAIETRRPLLRVTNTGYTVAVNPLGAMELLVPVETVGTGVTRLQRIKAGGAHAAEATGPQTLTLWWGNWGTALFFGGILLASVLIRSAPPQVTCNKEDKSLLQ